ncbi:MAG: GNAT family N-acetyltransferase [Verrucomicrobia bacterium]|nr:GNAT family N-acetyltransferase [Verrucomicrobiota bacterium]
MIRLAQPSDALEIATLFHRTVREVNRGDYTPEQIAVWAGEAPEPEKWRARLAKKTVFVEQAGARLAGFAEFDPDGHIDAVYVHAEHQGQGVASRLLERIEAEAGRAGLRRLFTEASITARPFFERRGFRLLDAQDVEYRGATFRNYRMEKLRP